MKHRDKSKIYSLLVTCEEAHTLCYKLLASFKNPIKCHKKIPKEDKSLPLNITYKIYLAIEKQIKGSILLCLLSWFGIVNMFQQWRILS